MKLSRVTLSAKVSKAILLLAIWIFWGGQAFGQALSATKRKVWETDISNVAQDTLLFSDFHELVPVEFSPRVPSYCLPFLRRKWSGIQTLGCRSPIPLAYATNRLRWFSDSQTKSQKLPKWKYDFRRKGGGASWAAKASP